MNDIIIKKSTKTKNINGKQLVKDIITHLDGLNMLDVIAFVPPSTVEEQIDSWLTRVLQTLHDENKIDIFKVNTNIRDYLSNSTKLKILIKFRQYNCLNFTEIEHIIEVGPNITKD